MANLKFKEGDPVEALPHSEFYPHKGVIIKVDTNGTKYPYRVEDTDRIAFSFREDDIQLAETEQPKTHVPDNVPTFCVQKFIKLTNNKGLPFYLNVSAIITIMPIRGGGSYLWLCGTTLEAQETPNEIIKIINDAANS